MLLVKKKDSFICLCVDFQELNYITQKDRYLLSLISNLLDSILKACVYTKINLYYTYYLVQIMKEDE